MQRPSPLKRSVDGWDDDELGKVYDHGVMRRLFPYLRPYKRQAVLALSGMFVAALAATAQPLLIALAVKTIIERDDLAGLNLIGASLLALALIAWGCSVRSADDHCLHRPPHPPDAAHSDVRPHPEAVAELPRQQRSRACHVARAERRDGRCRSC